MSSYPAGKPAEATIHQARTKPEATSFAIKNRQTNDWFRHDATTMSVPTDGRNKQPVGLTTGEWLIHDSKLRSEPPAAPVKRCLNQQAQATHDRVQGRQEDWYKHDDNRYYNDPLRPDRASDAGKKVKQQMETANGQTMAWYRHDSAASRGQPENGHKARLVGSAALQIGNKLQGKPGNPEWFEHDPDASRKVMEESMPKPRLTMKEAMSICERDRHGCTSEWCATTAESAFDDEYVPEQGGVYYRVTIPAGQEIAAKQSSVSEHWFEHDNRQPVVTNTISGQSKAHTAAVERIAEKHRGRAINELLGGAAGNGQQAGADLNLRLNRQDSSMYGFGGGSATSATGQYAQRSRQGTVGSVLDQQSNIGYQSPGRCPRAIKPEAAAILEKNKGCMEDCLQGYLPPASKHDLHKARPADSRLTEKHSGSAMEKTLKGESLDDDRANFARSVKPEGAYYAERNRGTVGQILTVAPAGAYRDTVTGGCNNLRTDAAQEIARKYRQGSAGAQIIC